MTVTTDVGDAVTSRNARVFYRDVKPYEAPNDLAELAGPAQGTVALPRNVYWGPWPEAHLGIESDVLKAYEALLREGRASDQKALMNRELLLKVWPQLVVPERVRDLWQTRFAELQRG